MSDNFWRDEALRLDAKLTAQTERVSQLESAAKAVLSEYSDNRVNPCALAYLEGMLYDGKESRQDTRPMGERTLKHPGCDYLAVPGRVCHCGKHFDVIAKEAQQAERACFKHRHHEKDCSWCLAATRIAEKAHEDDKA